MKLKLPKWHCYAKKWAITCVWCIGLLILSVSRMAAQTGSKTITWQASQVKAEAVLQAIEQQTGFTLTYNRDEMSKVMIPSLNWKSKPLQDALKELQDEYGILYSLSANNIALKLEPGSGTLKKAPGLVSGRVIDEENGQPVPDVSIKIGNKGTITGIDGSFSISLPQGKYNAEISSVGYGKKVVTDVEVKDNQTFELNVTLKREKGQLAGVVVTASARRENAVALYTKQKNSLSITDGISAEQIRVTPDNNAAQVLKRINGVTVQDEKFVTIRGLSDRYNNVQLNGATLPSTEANRRNFAFDIIPSGMIDNIVVSKTAMPDLPSEFAGGLVQLSTKDIPDKTELTVGVGSGYNTGSVGKSMLSTRRGSKDFLGYEDGHRQWWRRTWDRFEYADAFRAGNQEKMAKMNKRINNNWGLYEYAYNPVQNYQLFGGTRIDLKKGGSIGLTMGALYRHEERIDTEERRTYSDESYDFKGNSYQFRSSLGGLLNIAWQHKGSKIVLRNLYTHLFHNETEQYEGPLNGFGSGDASNYVNITLINDIWQRRLEGAHAIGKTGIRIDWSGDWISSLRDQPDTRYSIGTRSAADEPGYLKYYISDGTGFLGHGLSLYNSRLKETKYNWAGNITFPCIIAGQEGSLKTGYAGTYRDAKFESNGLLAVSNVPYQDRAQFEKEIFGLRDYELLSGDFLKPGGMFYVPTGISPVSVAGDDYTGLQRMHAWYAMLDLLMFKKLRLAGGIRTEKNRQEVNTITFDRITGLAVDSLVVYDKADWLPSASLTWLVTPKINARVAWSKTLSRADFRERSSFIYYEFKERTTYKGATSVKDAGITNMDIRLEMYPGPGEVISFSVFHKKFDSPVEQVASQGSSGLNFFYFNLRNSTSTGVEFDFRKSLGFINPQLRWLSKLFINGNASWMQSVVRYNTTELLNAATGVSGGTLETIPPDSRKRPLQGLSPYTINAGIGYFGKPFGINLSYNRFGRRIVAGGLYPFQDQYEAPRDVLDLQLSTRLLKEKLEVCFNISDLLQQPFRVYDNVQVIGGNTIVDNDTRALENSNFDPRGTRFNKELDYLRYKALRGTNLSLNIIYHIF